MIDKHAQQDQQYLGHTFVVQRAAATFRMAGLREEASRLRLTIRRRLESPSVSSEGQVEGQTPEGDPPADQGQAPEGDPPGVDPPDGPAPRCSPSVLWR